VYLYTPTTSGWLTTSGWFQCSTTNHRLRDTHEMRARTSSSSSAYSSVAMGAAFCFCASAVARADAGAAVRGGMVDGCNKKALHALACKV
jgi:hypothetical protein